MEALPRQVSTSRRSASKGSRQSSTSLFGSSYFHLVFMTEDEESAGPKVGDSQREAAEKERGAAC